MYVGSTIDVDVRGVADLSTIAAIEKTVRGTFTHMPGRWRVQVSASDERGRWDLRVHGGFGHYLTRFLATADRLAENVARRLHAFVQRTVPPLAVVVRRPVLVVRSLEPPRMTKPSAADAHRPFEFTRPTTKKSA
jgi:hypothetical protein